MPDDLQAIARKLGLSEDDPAVMENLRTISEDAMTDPTRSQGKGSAERFGFLDALIQAIAGLLVGGVVFAALDAYWNLRTAIAVLGCVCGVLWLAAIVYVVGLLRRIAERGEGA